MQALIDDLLAYSRVGRLELKIADVDTAGLVQSVRELSARSASAGRGSRWASCRRFVAEPTLLRQVFQNLIANTIKFTAGEDPRA